MKKRTLLSGKVVSLLFAICFISMALVGCGQKTENVETPTPAVTEEAKEDTFNVTLTDSTGETITLTKKPERIVSLAPTITEILYFLGLEEQIVGRTSYCNYPESILEVEEVGSTSEPNVETIVDLNPDLVVSAIFIPDEVINKLRELGIQVAFFNDKENFEGTYSIIEKLGMLTGTEDKATEVVNNMKQKVANLEEAVKALNLTQKPTVYYATGFGEGDYGAGGDTFIGEIITLAGGENIMKDISGWLISKEQLAEGDPDIIIVPSGADMATEMAKTDFYKDLRAVKEGRIYEIDGDSISRQSPRVADALVEMAQKIHPELVK